MTNKLTYTEECLARAPCADVMILAKRLQIAIDQLKEMAEHYPVKEELLIFIDRLEEIPQGRRHTLHS